MTIFELLDNLVLIHIQCRNTYSHTLPGQLSKCQERKSDDSVSDLRYTIDPMLTQVQALQSLKAIEIPWKTKSERRLMT